MQLKCWASGHISLFAILQSPSLRPTSLHFQHFRGTCEPAAAYCTLNPRNLQGVVRPDGSVCGMAGSVSHACHPSPPYLQRQTAPSGSCRPAWLAFLLDVTNWQTAAARRCLLELVDVTNPCSRGWSRPATPPSDVATPPVRDACLHWGCALTQNGAWTTPARAPPSDGNGKPQAWCRHIPLPGWNGQLWPTAASGTRALSAQSSAAAILLKQTTLQQPTSHMVNTHRRWRVTHYGKCGALSCLECFHS